MFDENLFKSYYIEMFEEYVENVFPLKFGMITSFIKVLEPNSKTIPVVRRLFESTISMYLGGNLKETIHHGTLTLSNFLNCLLLKASKEDKERLVKVMNSGFALDSKVIKHREVSLEDINSYMSFYKENDLSGHLINYLMSNDIIDIQKEIKSIDDIKIFHIREEDLCIYKMELDLILKGEISLSGSMSALEARFLKMYFDKGDKEYFHRCLIMCSETMNRKFHELVSMYNINKDITDLYKVWREEMKNE